MARHRKKHLSPGRAVLLAAAGTFALGAAAAAPAALRTAAAPAAHGAVLADAAQPAAPAAQVLPAPLNPGEQQKLAALLAAPQCTLNVPASPLSAAGLSVPWVLGSATAPCAENAATGAFVQATILDPATGALSVYEPLVVPAGQTPAVAPVPLTLPAGAVVTVWTGFNGNELKLAGPGAASFVNFAQQAWAASPQFFQALRTAVASGLVRVPPAGTASDGLPCPTTRDFSIVDQDQSDNVPSAELVTPDGAVAQDSAVNRADLPGSSVLFNGSDQGVVNAVAPALGCSTWKVPDLTNQGALFPSAPLEEEQASLFQQFPVALVPALDDFVTANGLAQPGGVPSLFLQNLYRTQVGQPANGNSGDTQRYCAELGLAGAPRLQLDSDAESAAPAPSFAAGLGLNLALVLANRFSQTWTLLGCQVLTGVPSPVRVTLSGTVATAASFTAYAGPRFGLPG